MARDEWVCWSLSKSDIDEAAQRTDIDTSMFTDDDYNEIARLFKKGFDWANIDWDMVLDEAIRQVVEKRKGEPR